MQEKKSVTGIYHIMLRGIDKRDIFLDNEDKLKFIEKMMKAKENGKFKLYGYCLMDNHVHLLIKEKEEIGISIKRITVGYVIWHNNKYGRTGHLFQNRFMSEPVESESYYLTVLRYIHQNPVKARIVSKVNDYLWSSYNQYVLAYQQQSVYVDIDLSKVYFETINDFNKYMNEQNKDECLEYKSINKITDFTLQEIIHKEYNTNNLEKFSKEERNRIIKEIYHKTGASIRQIERVTGIGKKIIEKAIKGDNGNVPLSL